MSALALLMLFLGLMLVVLILAPMVIDPFDVFDDE